LHPCLLYAGCEEGGGQRARRLGIVVNLEDEDGDEVGPSQQRGDDGQGYSSGVAKAEPPSAAAANGTYYDIFHQCLGMQ
jgi:hypothetical protein